jgi:hypothetical protein
VDSAARRSAEVEAVELLSVLDAEQAEELERGTVSAFDEEPVTE